MISIYWVTLNWPGKERCVKFYSSKLETVASFLDKVEFISKTWNQALCWAELDIHWNNNLQSWLYFIIICRKFRLPYLGMARAALPSPINVCSIFYVSKQWSGCQGSGFLMHAVMLMHMIAHVGCTDIVKQSALETDSGRKIACHARDLNPCHYCDWLFSCHTGQ